MSLIKVNVTAEDIDHGVAGDCGQCPIALALARLVPAHLEVESASVTFCLPPTSNGFHSHAESDLPDVAQLFVQDFDNGDHVVPFSFDFWMPDEVAA